MRHDDGGARIAWIDELRFTAFCAVALLHVSWIESHRLGAHDLIGFSTRFAVPAFFMISGFMIERKGRGTREVIVGTFARLFPVFVFWEVVYVLVDVVAGGRFHPLPEATAKGLARFAVATVYNGGVAFHLWFVVWLGISVAIFVGLRRFGPVVSWGVIASLFVFGLAIGPYGAFTGLLDHVGPLATRPVAYTARNGPFFGPLFVALGALIARRDLRPPLAAAVGLIVVGLGMEIVEGSTIAARGARFVSSWDVTFATPIFALGVVFLFRSFEGARGEVARRWAAAGRLSLGLYCVHALFTDLWNARFPPEARDTMPVAATVLGAIGVILASLVVVSILARVRSLRRFVV